MADFRRHSNISKKTTESLGCFLSASTDPFGQFSIKLDDGDSAIWVNLSTMEAIELANEINDHLQNLKAMCKNG